MNLFSLLSVTFQQADKGRKRTLITADSLLYVKFTIQGLEFRSKNESSRKCAVICKVIYFHSPHKKYEKDSILTLFKVVNKMVKSESLDEIKLIILRWTE